MLVLLEDRLAPAGLLDPTFASPLGALTTSVGFGADGGRAVAVQPDGRTLVAGYSQTGSRYDFAVTRHLNDGSLDTSFGAGGKVVTQFGDASSKAFGMTVQPDGKIVLAGYAFNASSNDFALVRLLPTGALDTSFDGDGRVVTPIGSLTDAANTVAVQPDGKIVAGGYSSNGSNTDYALARYNPDGSLDATFDGDGKVTTAVGPGNEEVKGLAVQADGKIVAAGFASNGKNDDAAVARYTPAGALDTTFDGDGKVTTDSGLGNDYGIGVAVHPDGKIVVGGSANNGANLDYAAYRYTTTGALDTTFDGDGFAVAPVGPGSDSGEALAVYPDGRIVVAGRAFNGANNDFGIARFTATGALDTAFDGDGRATTPIGPGNETVFGVVVQPDGRVAAAGLASNGFNDDFALARYNPDGSRDVSLTGGRLALSGRVQTDFGGGADNGHGVAVQADGRILVAGTTTFGTNPDSDFGLARYNPDGTLDPTFGTGGTVITDLQGGDDSAYALAVQPDGKIVAAGKSSTFNGSSTHIAVVRYNPDGSTDPSFHTSISFFGNEATAYSVALQADGKIVLGGTFVNGPANDFALMRLNPDGTLDGTFGTNGRVSVDFAGRSDYGQAVAVHPDGRIVLAGYTLNPADPFPTADFALARFLPNGALEYQVTTDFAGSVDAARGVAIQPDGKIVAAGDAVVGTAREFALARYNANGTLDTTFGTGGRVTTDLGGSEVGFGARLLADGTILVAGRTSGTTAGDFAVARYTTTGALDTSFGVGGKATIDFAGRRDSAAALAVQPDGRIVLAGNTYDTADTTGASGDFALARLRADGTLDPALTDFPHGRVVTPIGTSNDEGRAVAVQPDGKVVVSGTAFSTVNSRFEFAVTRYHADGTLDATFGTGGKAVAAVGAGDAFAYAVAVQPDGKILVAGSATGVNSDFVVMRFNANGTPDTGFGTNAATLVNFGLHDVAYGLAVQPDGKIVLAGQAQAGATYGFALARLTPGGTLDTTFGTGGLVTTLFGTVQDAARAVALQPDGGIVAAGFAHVGTTYDVAVARYTPAGLLDTTFDGDGKTTTAVGPDSDYATSVLVQPDGRIVTAGASYSGPGIDANFALVRFTPAGALDTTFAGNGKVTASFGAGHDIAEAVVQDATGRIIVAGSASNGANADFALARFYPNGFPDTTFGTAGRAATAFGPGDDVARGLAVQADGRVVAVGHSFNGSNTDFAVARYTGAAVTVQRDLDGNLEVLEPFSGVGNHLTFRRVGDALRITDSSGTPVSLAAGLTGAYNTTPWSAVVPLASFTGGLEAYAGPGHNSLVLDYRDGSPLPTGGTVGAAEGVDTLAVLAPASGFDSVTIDYTRHGGFGAIGFSGTLTLDGVDVRFSGINGLAPFGPARSFKYIGTATQDYISVLPDGPGSVLVRTTNFLGDLTVPTVRFRTAGATSLSVDGSFGDDQITVANLAGSYGGPLGAVGGPDADTIVVEAGGVLTAAGGHSAGLSLSGTLNVGADATFDWLAGPSGGVAALAAGTALTVGGSGAITQFDGTIIGAGRLVKTGSGTMTLTGTNAYSGGTTVLGGTLAVSQNAALGAASGTVTVQAPGRLTVTASTTSGRQFFLNLGTLRVNAGATLTLNNAQVVGGYLLGPGAIATTAGGATAFVASRTFASLTLLANGTDSFTNFDNGGRLTLVAGRTFALDVFTNTSGGRLTINGTANVSDFVTNGYVEVSKATGAAQAGALVNVGTSPLVIGGGGVLNIGYTSPPTGGGGPVGGVGGNQAAREGRGRIDFGTGGMQLLSGAVVRNNGFIDSWADPDGEPPVLLLTYGSTYFYGDSLGNGLGFVDFVTSGGTTRSGF